ncbi:hypothetical protein EYF80_060017 [Liparis tanakae]|uniref:Uncharacterized protein n=1 Tax=Liparis tanakae TaxID=230148 RepID=A0A4Z2ELV6_9TELE|nr:hypothetical protein EYF80_060017 [Liparis tanakae]
MSGNSQSDSSSSKPPRDDEEHKAAHTLMAEDLQTFLLSVRHQCCYLTETVQDVIGRFPRHASQVCRRRRRLSRLLGYRPCVDAPRCLARSSSSRWTPRGRLRPAATSWWSRSETCRRRSPASAICCARYTHTHAQTHTHTNTYKRTHTHAHTLVRNLKK